MGDENGDDKWSFSGSWQLAVGCWPLASGFRLPASGCWSLVAGFWWLVVGHFFANLLQKNAQE
jgi:hypothetical protein